MINIILSVALTLFIFVASAGEYPHLVFPENDTLKIFSAGENNSIEIDSSQFPISSIDSLSQTVSGLIEQTGTNNSVKISNQKNTRQNITIKQTGKNNKIKINSQ